MEMIPRILFLALSNTDVQFGVEKLTWRSYTTARALPITRQIELIDKYKFAKATLYENSEMYVVYIATLKASKLIVNPSRTFLLAMLQ